MKLACPGCGEVREFGPEVQDKAIVACKACAGALFRLVKQAGVYQLREVPRASCPRCEVVVQLPETVQPGDTARHCAQTFVVTYAYGAYALEFFSDDGAAL